MMTLCQPSTNNLTEWTDEQLEECLNKAISLSVEFFSNMAAVWRELARRGRDMGKYRKVLAGLLIYLPEIAAGVLAAEAVVAFAGQTSKLHALRGMDLEDQRKHAAREIVIEYVDPVEPKKVERKTLVEMPCAAVKTTFENGKIKSVTDQRHGFRKPAPEKPQERTARTVPYNPEDNTVRIAGLNVPMSEILSSVAASKGPDIPPMDDPSTWVKPECRLTQEEYKRFTSQCRKYDLTQWEVIRKAMRAFGLI